MSIKQQLEINSDLLNELEDVFNVLVEKLEPVIYSDDEKENSFEESKRELRCELFCMIDFRNQRLKIINSKIKDLISAIDI